MKTLSLPNSYTVDLSMHFNNKGITNHDRTIQGKLDHSGLSLAGELLPNDEIKVVGGVAFRFARTDTHVDDHICCEQQRVELPCENASSISLLGFSLYGDYNSPMHIQYEDGVTEKCNLGLSDWFCLSLPGNKLRFGEEPGIFMDYHYYGDNKIQSERGIWLQHIALNNTKKVQHIELPDNPYMFVFAITVNP